MKKIIFLSRPIIVMFFLIPLFCPAQNKTKETAVHALLFQGGSSLSKYRDSGVSPLLYKGILPWGAIAYSANTSKWQLNIGTNGFAGIFSQKSDLATYSTQGISGVFNASYLRLLPTDPDKLFQYYLGGDIQHDINFRISPHYMNAQFVTDNISSIALRGKIHYDFNIPAKSGKFLFVKFNRPQRYFHLGYTVSLPFFTALYRPGFSYVSNGTSGENDVFDGYIWSTMIYSGFRSSLEFRKYLKNGNAIGLTYNFSVFSSSGKSNFSFVQTASHQLGLLFYFRMN